jgi:hypothetical protein
MTLKKRLALIIILGMASMLTSGLLALYVNIYFLLMVIFFQLITAFFTLTLLCPHCNKKVLYFPVEILGLKVPFCICWIPKQCPHCKSNLQGK